MDASDTHCSGSGAVERDWPVPATITAHPHLVVHQRMTWTYVSKHAYQAEGCTCVRSRGDHAQCPLHQEEYRLRQTGCTCFAGWQMSDGSWVDPYCEAHDDESVD